MSEVYLDHPSMMEAVPEATSGAVYYPLGNDCFQLVWQGPLNLGYLRHPFPWWKKVGVLHWVPVSMIGNAIAAVCRTLTPILLGVGVAVEIRNANHPDEHRSPAFGLLGMLLLMVLQIAAWFCGGRFGKAVMLYLWVVMVYVGLPAQTIDQAFGTHYRAAVLCHDHSVSAKAALVAQNCRTARGFWLARQGEASVPDSQITPEPVPFDGLSPAQSDAARALRAQQIEDYAGLVSRTHPGW